MTKSATVPNTTLIAADPGVYTRREAADYCKLSVRTIDKLLASGDLPYVQLGSRVLIFRTDLDGLLRANRRTGRAA